MNEIKDYIPGSYSGLVGVAETDITPPVGIYARNWGAAIHDIAEGIHQPLLLSCITFQTAASAAPLILISADFGVWRSPVAGKKIRNRILEAFAIPLQNLMFCLTHTHSGPVLSREEKDKAGGDLTSNYLDEVENKAVEVIREALNKAVSATVTWQYGTCTLASNRDLYYAVQGRFITGFNPEKQADHTLLTGRITDQHNQIIATIVNYACHPTTFAWQNKLISPDFVGPMRALVSGVTQAPCLFLQGASGDLAPNLQYVADPEVVEKHGRQLGYAVLSALESMLPPQTKLSFEGVVESGADLAIWKTAAQQPSDQLKAEVFMVDYELRPLPFLAEIEQKYKESTDRVVREKLWRQRSLRINLGDGNSTQVPLWVWKIGDAVFVGQQNEAYAEFQEKIRKELPGPVAVINLVNGSAGYLPPDELYDEDIYSVKQTPFARGSLEKLLAIALAAVKKIGI